MPASTTVAPEKLTANSKLHQARKAKNDEFYTRLEDVEAELYHYRDKFRDKTVYLNCDDPRWSAFWRYFALSFQHLGLKRLIATHYTGVTAPGTSSYGFEILRGRDEDADGRIGVKSGVQFDLAGDGDFRSDECVELLKQSDIVVTNPPFSEFRTYVAQLIKHDKSFLLIGNMNAITYKEIWPLIQDGNLWLGATGFNTGMFFGVPDDFVYADTYKFPREMGGYQVSRVPGICWFTNLDHSRRHEEIPLYMKYAGNEAHYPRYDNYDAIEVSKVKEIPEDYDGVMGVPITFLGKWNPGQLEILGCSYDYGRPGEWAIDTAMSPSVGGRNIYKRIFIRRTAQSLAIEELAA